MISRLLRSAIPGVFLLAAFGSPAGAEPLQDAVLSAINNHPQVQSALAGRDAAIQGEKEAYSAYFPEVRISGAAGRVYGDNSTSRGLSVSRGAGYSGMGEGNVSVSQMLFDGFQTRDKVDAARAMRDSENGNIVDVRETLAYQAVQAYIDLLRAREGLRLVDEHGRKISDFIEKIKIKVKEGASDDSELRQAQDIGFLMENMRAEYRGRLDSATAVYEEVTGHAPDESMDRPASVKDVLPENAESAVTRAMAEHPMLDVAGARATAAEREADAEEAGLLPDLSAEGSYYQKDIADVIGGEVADARALVRLNWGFSTGGAELARVRKKRFEEARSRADTEQARRQIERGVRQSWAELETARRQTVLSSERVNINESLNETYRSQFEGAKITLLQLLQGENALFNTRLDRMNAGYRLLAAEYGVLAGMGVLQKSLNYTAAPDDPAKAGKTGFFSLRINN